MQALGDTVATKHFLTINDKQQQVISAAHLLRCVAIDQIQ